MLIIEAVNPTGMFSFGDCQDIDLRSKGLINFVGVNNDTQGASNGSGKSSLFNAICELLFHKNPTRVSGEGIINHIRNQGFSGRLVFTAWEGIKYRVTYCRKQKRAYYNADNDNRVEYTGTALFFDKFVSGSWVDSRGASMDATKKLVQNTLGFTYEQFVAVAYMTPRQGSVLLKGDNKARMDVLSGITGLGVWDTLLDTIKREKLDCVRKRDDLEKQVAYLEGELNQIKLQNAGVSPEDVEFKLNEITLSLEKLQHTKTHTESSLILLNEQLQSIQTDRVQTWADLELDKYAGCVAKIQAEIAKLQVDRVNCKTAINSQLAVETNKAERELNVARGTLAAVKGNNKLVDVSNCPTCGVRITQVARNRMMKNIKSAEKAVTIGESEIKRVSESVANDRREQEVGVAQIQRDIDHQLEALNTQSVQQAEAHAANLVKYNDFYRRITQLQVKIADTQVQIVAYETTKADWNTKILVLNDTMNLLNVQKQCIETKQVEYDTKHAEWQVVVNEIAHYTWLVVNIPYIKLHKLSVALTELSTLVNGYLQATGDTANITISSFTAKKKSTSELKIDQLKGEISVSIVDGQKDIDPRLYSDGETARFSSALARALHDLAIKHGQGCNLVLLDEIFSFIDAGNSQKIASSFVNDLPDDSTYIITDNSGVATNLMDFDDTWLVTKENGLSQITIS